MARVCFQCLANYNNNENLLNSIKKSSQRRCKIRSNTKSTLKKIAYNSKMFAKVAKFCQIWSH